jgi:DNA repair protein RadC
LVGCAPASHDFVRAQPFLWRAIMEGAQLELPGIPLKVLPEPAVPRHKRVSPPVHVLMDVGGGDFPPRDDGVDLTVLYNHNGTAFLPASDAAILASADKLLMNRLRRGTSLLEHPNFLRRFLRAKVARQRRAAFFAFFLDRRARVIQVAELFKGTTNSVVVHPREVFRAALECDAEGAFCARTDPGGDFGATETDFIDARKLRDTLQLGEIRLFDYLVVGNTIISLASKGCFQAGER